MGPCQFYVCTQTPTLPPHQCFHFLTNLLGCFAPGLGTAPIISCVQDYLNFKGLKSPLAKDSNRDGRMIALVGDAELDEGNVYEALMER